MKDFDNEIFEIGRKIGAGYGMDNLTIEIVSKLFIEPEPVSLEELVEFTGYSISTLSSKLQMMEKMSVVMRVKKPGSKKAFYFIEKDMKERLKRKFEKMIEVQFKPIRVMIPPVLDKYREKVKKSKDENFKQKFKFIEYYFNFIVGFEKEMKKFIEKIEEM